MKDNSQIVAGHREGDAFKEDSELTDELRRILCKKE